MLDMRTVATGSPGWIASTLIHEATHARLDVRGVPYTRANRARCERVCRLAEWRFIELLDAETYPSKERWLATVDHLSARGGQGAHRATATHKKQDAVRMRLVDP